MSNKERKKLGDEVEEVIKKVLPKLAKKYEGCKGCGRRKKFLNNYNAIFGLGMMLTEFGDLDRAEQAFSQVIDLNPNHENASNALERLTMDGIGREL